MANDFLTVQQAQYLLWKWKAEADAKYAAQSDGILTNPSITNGTLTFSSDANRNSWLSSLGLNTAPSDHDSGNVSSTSGTDATLCNTGSLAAGHAYLMVCAVGFSASASGRRTAYLTTSSTGSALNRYTQETVTPVSGVYTRLQFSYAVYLTTNTTFYLRAYQNSGATLTVIGGIQVIKLY